LRFKKRSSQKAPFRSLVLLFPGLPSTSSRFIPIFFFGETFSSPDSKSKKRE